MSAFAFFTLLGVAILAYAGWRWRRVSMISAWPAAPARVETAAMQKTGRVSFNFWSKDVYSTTLVYKYEVAEKYFAVTGFRSTISRPGSGTICRTTKEIRR